MMMIDDVVVVASLLLLLISLQRWLRITTHKQRFLRTKQSRLQLSLRLLLRLSIVSSASNVVTVLSTTLGGLGAQQS